ncbi:hypothetical protein [Nocardia aurantia]|uniref:Immunity protein CdiI n=1 Tax=Nocardia aurantia TaxID=2585199 RepID=A0A7K0DMA0_9NOCA|nr:hypothetical protein [Nocardia aurantia]MQY26876.1 Immunity protein CdiI [Nocardia aurantia]
MPFAITLTGETAADDPTLAIGALTLGHHTENFRTPIGHWTATDYETSWSLALNRLVHGATISCLVTAMRDPRKAHFLEIWPLYREDRMVHVQNQLLFLNELDREFDPTKPWNFIEPHSTADEDGQRISEWSVLTSHIEEFLKNR